jgi:hypothetical protein
MRQQIKTAIARNSQAMTVKHFKSRTTNNILR